MFQKIKKYFENRKFSKQIQTNQFIHRTTGCVDIFYGNKKPVDNYNFSLVVNRLIVKSDFDKCDEKTTNHKIFNCKFEIKDSFQNSMLSAQALKSIVDNNKHNIDVTTNENFLEQVKQNISWHVIESIELLFKEQLATDLNLCVVEATFLKNRRKKGLYLMQATHPRTIEDSTNVEIFVDHNSITISTKNKNGYIRFNLDEKFQKAHHDWLDICPDSHTVLAGGIDFKRNLHYKEFVETIANEITENIFGQIIKQNLLPLTENQKSYVAN
jgi:hypothetical protein